MREKLNRIGSTRRSFMKKSVVAAVAASNLTIFSGLVDASEEQGSGNGAPCKLVKVAGEGGVCRTWNDKDWYPASSGHSIYGCLVYCDPANPQGEGGGSFLAWCTPDGVPVNNGWYSGTTGCAGPTDETQPANPAE